MTAAAAAAAAHCVRPWMLSGKFCIGLSGPDTNLAELMSGKNGNNKKERAQTKCDSSHYSLTFLTFCSHFRTTYLRFGLIFCWKMPIRWTFIFESDQVPERFKAGDVIVRQTDRQTDRQTTYTARRHAHARLALPHRRTRFRIDPNIVLWLTLHRVCLCLSECELRSE